MNEQEAKAQLVIDQEIIDRYAENDAEVVQGGIDNFDWAKYDLEKPTLDTYKTQWLEARTIHYERKYNISITR